MVSCAGRFGFLHSLVVCFVFVSLSLTVKAEPASPGAGITVDDLRTFADTTPQIEFQHLRDNPSVAGERRQVMTFNNDGLRQYALILWPAGDKPAEGWPVLLFNHGYHPNPPDYGRIEGGQDSRPGDYYRGIAQAFVDNGYVVVTPDYRGHNDSEGAEFTTRVLADYWYTRDAIAAYFGLASLDDIDHQQVYMLGHSMGGPITQRALLALGDKIKAASVWSTSGERPVAWLMAMEMKDGNGFDTPDTAKPMLDKLSDELEQLGNSMSIDDLSTWRYIDQLEVPLTIQHSKGDGSTNANSSRELAARLYLARHEYQLFLYESDDHLFSGEDFEQAVERDLLWFERYH